MHVEESYTAEVNYVLCKLDYNNEAVHGVGEGGAGGATAPPLLKVGGHCPPTLGHDCTLKFNEEKISSCSMSATVGYLVSIKGIAS